MTSFGVPAGATKPKYTGARLGKPSSFKVGTSGNSGERVSESTAIAFTAPLLICGMKFGRPTIDTGTVPVSSPVTMSLPPRDGTMMTSAPVFFFQFSKVICIGMASTL